MKHAAKRVRGGRPARASRARSHAPVFLFVVAAATGAAVVCAPQFPAFAQTGPAKPSASSAPLKPADPAIKTTFPVAGDAPTLFAQTPVDPSGHAQPFEELPLTQVREDDKGNADSTRAVNAITSFAFTPMNGGGIRTADAPVWLGTQYGLKRVQNRTARYYTPSDGLPGTYVEAVAAAADAKSAEAWCLVRPAPVKLRAASSAARFGNAAGGAGRLALCAWDKRADTWATVAEIPTPLSMELPYNADDEARVSAQRASRQFARWFGQGRLAVSPRYIAFASSVVSRDADAIASVWDKKAQKLRPVAWDETLFPRVTPFVGVSFVFMDDARQVLWLGTSQGLFAYSLDKGTWRAFLPGQVVSTGAVSTSGRKTALYVAYRVPDEPVSPMRSSTTVTFSAQEPDVEPVAPRWRLLRVDLPTGETTELPTPPQTRAPYQDPFGVFQGEAMVPNEPARLFVDEHNVLWATLSKAIALSRSHVANTQIGGIDRYDPVAKTWQHFGLVAAPSRFPWQSEYRPRPNDAGGPGSGTETVPPDPALVQLDTVPTEALFPLMQSVQTPRGPFNELNYYGGASGYEAYGPLLTTYWIRHRVPFWYGKNDAEAASAQPFFDARYVTPDAAPGSDAKAAVGEEIVWYVHNNDTLARAPRADLGPNDGVQRIGLHSSGISSARPARAEFFPIDTTFASQRAPIRRLMRANRQNPAQLLVQVGAALFLVDAQKNTWQNITVNGQNRALADLNAPVIAGTSLESAPLLQPNSSGSSVLRWNAATGSVEMAADLPVPSTNARLLGNGQNGAIWFVSSNSDVAWYQKPTPPTSLAPLPAQRVAPQAPAAWLGSDGASQNRPLRPFAAQGSRVWYKVPVQSGYFAQNAFWKERGGASGYGQIECLAGLDVATQKWTTPLPLPRNTNSGPYLLTVQDQTYVATTAGNPNGSVWKWDAAKSDWEVVAPPLPPEPSLFDSEDYSWRRPVFPISVDDAAIWVSVAGRMIARYDRAKQKWQTADLPDALRTAPYDAQYNSNNGPQQTPSQQIGQDTFCVSSERGGLWRLRATSIPQNGAKLSAEWEPLSQPIVIRSRTDAEQSKSIEFTLSRLVVTPRTVWALGSHQDAGFSFAARWDKQAQTWTVWDEASGFPARGDYVGVMAADGDALWLTCQSGTYRFDEAANRWRLVVWSGEPGRLVPPAAAIEPKGGPGQPVGQVARIASDETGVYLLFGSAPQKNPNTLLWRWNRGTNALEPLPFPAGGAEPVAAPGGRALLSEPGVVWVGTTSGLWAWDKTTRTWSQPPLPLFAAPIKPYSILRKNDALLLVGSAASETEGPHVLRLTSPPFLKRP